MFKKLIAVSFAMLMAASANAVVCETSQSMTMTFKDAPSIKNSVTFNDMSPGELDKLNKRNLATLDKASKLQDKGGQYAFTFDGSQVCDGVSKVNPAVMVKGVTHEGSAEIWRIAFRGAEATIKQSEEHVKKGHKKAFKED